MPYILTEEYRREFRAKVLHAAAIMFLENGYVNVTTRGLAKRADVQVSAMNRAFGSKENILCELVTFVLERQFDAAKQFIAGKTEDPVLYYAAETTLQLYMAESNEAVRELYAAAYSMPNSAELIRKTVTEKLVSKIFKDYLPDADLSEFYLRELSSGGIIRGHMMLSCDETFTMEKKVRSFLGAALRIYQVPEEKISEAIEFVGQFDYPTLAKTTIEAMFEILQTESWQ